MDTSTVLLAGAALGFSQFVKGITGFGSALLAMPVLVMLMPLPEAILLMATLDLLAGALLVWDERHRINGVLVACIFAGVIPGQWLGTELLLFVNPQLSAGLLGVLVLAMGLRFATRPVVEGHGELSGLPEDRRALLTLGGVSGFAGGLMGGLVGAGGPPIVAFCKRFFDDRFYRAQLVAVFGLGALVLIGMLLVKGVATETLAPVPVLLIPVIAGNRLGAWLMPKVSRERFGRLTGVILVVSGLSLLWPLYSQP